MKTIAFGFIAALALGAASIATPASAAPAPSAAGISQTTDISAARYVVRRTVVRRGPHCTFRTIVTRGPYGKRVKRVRICR